MTLQTAQLTLFAIFASLALASWFIVKRVANFLEAAKGLSELVAWLHALAFSGEGGASIWPGHRVILHREYGHSESAQLKAAGRRAFVLLWLGDIDTAVLVVTMLVGSLRLPEFCKRPLPAVRE